LLDSTAIINDITYLASDLCEGRRPGTAGHLLAFNYIRSRMQSIGLDSIASAEQTFTGIKINNTTIGKNLIGLVKGVKTPGKYIVLTAHYDHLGKKNNGAVYNGADDNASGVACVLGIAAYLENHAPGYSVIVAALDREETGLEGAYSFVDWLNSNVGLKNIVLNLNMDMIARADKNEIFVSGLGRNPSLMYVIDKVQDSTKVEILKGHEGGDSGEDWSESSDHAAFMKKSVPFLYFGVEDHADYHQTTDDIEKINYSRYIEICNMLNLAVRNVK
jgi:Zn-dependent M28 family amino/carboxypeptidase